MSENNYILEPVGVIHSELKSVKDAPKQGDEGDYEARIELLPEFVSGLMDIQVGDQLIILTWLHLSQRDKIQVHPRGKTDRPLTGVFATRSPNRPNPIGLHTVSVLEIDGQSLRVAPIEAVDGTPVIDIKPILSSKGAR